MKLCFLAGADSIHSKKWVQYFADKGHEVHWISLTPNECGAKSDNLNLYLMPKLGLVDLLFKLARVRKLIKKINPDILHSHYAKLNGVIGVLSGFRPFVLTAWGSDVLIAPKFITKRPFVRLSLKKADLITCDAEHVKEAMINLGADSSKIHIIRFGIDTQKFKPGEKDKFLREKLKLGYSPTVISLRSLEPVYDVETLIRAVPFIVKEIPATKFIIVGKGNQREWLKGLAKNFGVSKNIRFVGFLQNEEILEYLQISDVYVSTALSDAGIASSTAEAMACGVSIVITDSGENRKWVEDTKNGFIIPIRNHKILAEKIIFLLKNKTVREKFGQFGRKIIQEKNDYYREMQKMENLYRSLIKLS